MSNKKRPLIYIAGPYRSKTTWGIECNIQDAKRLGVSVLAEGGFPVIPHANTAHFDGLASDEVFLDGTMEMLRRCDGVVLGERWKDSYGSRLEKDEADRLGIPVLDHFRDNVSIARWIKEEAIPYMERRAVIITHREIATLLASVLPAVGGAKRRSSCAPASQVAVLLAVSDGPLSVGELRDVLGVPQSTTTQWTAEAITAGVVERVLHEFDQRRHVVRITPAGQVFLCRSRSMKDVDNECAEETRGTDLDQERTSRDSQNTRWVHSARREG